ncbi:dihydrolipoyl dehydrogenase family protein [Rubricoccus marinus]|uniref:Mercuric reductase n=1 Tax=Rubricoccus marinus TaxID=716817 RepID=A0A259U1N1_9BACT|nr:FAD-dependent oxidoreductase [Rubricoccus marinus]OZC03899.1 mercuric reductase [Rubricoccus marinus]
MAQYDFDYIVIGGGSAGLTAAGIAANAGVKTMMIERDRLGGDCTWTGCVPSKALLHAAHLAHHAREASAFGVDAEVSVRFGDIMRHVHALREEVYEDADDPAIYEGFGIEVVHGDARFINPHTIEITPEASGGDHHKRRVTSRMFVICSGGRAAPPPIKGLDAVDYLTNETLFEITEQPEHLAIVGAGPIGIEMGQAFNRLGTQVTIVDNADRILGRDDPDHADTLRQRLEEEGVRFVFGAKVERVEAADASGVRLHLGGGDTLEADRLLIATGRKPNIETLNLGDAGIEYTKKGITVDDRCRTSQGHIWAAGDCTGEYQLTHMSEHMAKVATTNAILKIPSSIDRAGVPWTTFSDPELAHLGASEEELQERGESYVTYDFPYTKVDRGITEGKTIGSIKVFATEWRGKILGASVLGERAGELMQIFAVAMKAGTSLQTISDTIFAYPTYALGARRAADQWYVQKQFPVAIKALQTVLGYRGTVPPPPDPDRVM